MMGDKNDIIDVYIMTYDKNTLFSTSQASADQFQARKWGNQARSHLKARPPEVGAF